MKITKITKKFLVEVVNINSPDKIEWKKNTEKYMD